MSGAETKQITLTSGLSPSMTKSTTRVRLLGPVKEKSTHRSKKVRNSNSRLGTMG